MQENVILETPSGKGAGDENFPVGSRLLPRRLRPHVAVFYAFARAADDIADNPDLPPEEKIRRLDAFASGLLGKEGQNAPDKAARLRDSLIATNVTPRHGQDLLAAFKQDALKNRYADWDDLIGYCMLSAAPVGRYLLDLHGETDAPRPYTDALCNALQILNHLQDCGKDFHDLDRVYLPGDWLAAENIGVDSLNAQTAGSGLRNVIDHMLDGVERLLEQAGKAPGAIAHPRLAAETAVIVQLAWRLTARLRRQDPLKQPVKLSKIDFALAVIGGVLRVAIGRLLKKTRPAR